METKGTSPEGTPLAQLLHERVERVLASWSRVPAGVAPPRGAVDRFMSALRSLEQAADALSSGQAPETQAVLPPTWEEIDAARSYAHLAGILPRALQRTLKFDGAAAALRHSNGELLVDAVSNGDPAFEEAVRERATQLAILMEGRQDDAVNALPPRPAMLRSSLFIPLAARGRVVGVTYVASAREHAFTEADHRLLADLASHASGTFRRLDGDLAVLRTTARQAQVLSLVAAGFSDKEIAEQLGLSHRTVRTHLERLLKEHGLRSRTEAVTAWLRGRRD